MIGRSRLIAVHDEPRGLVRAVGVDHTAHLEAGFFRPQPAFAGSRRCRRRAADPRVTQYKRLTVIGLVFVDRVRHRRWQRAGRGRRTPCCHRGDQIVDGFGGVRWRGVDFCFVVLWSRRASGR